MSDRDDGRRLIESAFPLKEASIDSVHEKNVRHGHISTLHVWPARRPLAAGRAVLLATLLDDPGSDGRRELLLRIGGRVARKATGRGEKEETTGGVLHWGRESSPGLARLREEVRAAFGGRAPKVLDPFAGGGAIPLEAMRLGCEVTASDINPVAWFILRCTLHYPRLMAGKTRPLPAPSLRDRAFVEAFLKAQGIGKASDLRAHLARLGHGDDGAPGHQTAFDPEPPESSADFPWHLRAWGRRVLAEARRELASRYPTFAEFEPVRRKGRRGEVPLPPKRFPSRPPVLLAPDAQGRVSVEALNAALDPLDLEDPRNPRWVAKPTVAYLWARTAECGHCRAEVPLLKTLWLCKRGGKRVRLAMAPREDGSGVDFALEREAPGSGGADGRGGAVGRGDGDGDGRGGAAAGRGAGDDRLGAGTMSRSGVRCPCCGAIATMRDLRAQGRAGRLGARMTAVVVDGQEGKEYRLPREEEVEAAKVSRQKLEDLYAEIPFGLPRDPTPKAGIGASRAFSVDGYGLSTWDRLFSDRQLLALGVIVRQIRRVREETGGYPEDWSESLTAALSCSFGKLADYSSAVCSWHNGGEKLRDTFARFALPMVWDYCEVNPLSETSGGFAAMLEWVARFFDHAVAAAEASPEPAVARESAITLRHEDIDLICTDPPYYDAIPYSDLMDFFHVWLRRVLHGLSPEADAAFASALGPKWSPDEGDGELIDDASRFGGDRSASKQSYEDGMARAFGRFHAALRDGGRLVVVFANKQPDAWETLVSALIRAGFVVVGSWPVRTEREARQRSLSSAALASSIWIVCKKRPPAARAGWERSMAGDQRGPSVARRPRGLGSAGAGGDAEARHRAAPGLLGRGDPGAGLRLGRDRPRARSVQPPSGGEDHRRPGPAARGGRVPPPRAAHGGGLRRQPPARPGRGRRGRAGRRDDLLPAAPQRLRPPSGLRRGQHSLRALLQPLGFGPRGPAGPSRSRRRAPGRGGRGRGGGDGPGRGRGGRGQGRGGRGQGRGGRGQGRGGRGQGRGGRGQGRGGRGQGRGDRGQGRGGRGQGRGGRGQGRGGQGQGRGGRGRGRGGRGQGRGGRGQGRGGRGQGRGGRGQGRGGRGQGRGGRGRSLGEPSSDGAPPPLIDCLHKLMQLWKAGDRRRVDGYLERRGLWRHELFARLAQAVLELAERGSEERSILESIQNHLRATDAGPDPQRPLRLDPRPG